MSIRPREFSIVVVANDCNPTILNPDFLERQGIVPEDWGWKLSAPPMSTPPFATVSYDSGVTLSVEANKLQVVDASTNWMHSPSRIPEIASKYIQVLPHVRYTAVGHNFRVFVENPEPSDFLKQRFLKPGSWDAEGDPLDGVSVKFVYLLEDCRLTLSLEESRIIQRAEGVESNLVGIMAYANYHRDCQGYPSDGQVLQHLKHIKQDVEHFQQIRARIME